MKGAPLEFGGHSFQGLESCVAWARTHMRETTYQCIPSMFYGLCLIRESVLYKQDMREDIQAHRVQRSPMQSAAVESVNTAVPSILEGPKSNVLKDPKHDFGVMKTFAEWKPTNGQGGASARLKEGLEGAWQQIRGAIDLFLGGSPSAKGVMQEMLAEYKIHTSAVFITELTLYYDEPVQDGGRPPSLQGGQGVLLGTRHQAPQDNSEGDPQGAAVRGGGGVYRDGLTVNQWDVPVRGPGRTPRLAGVRILRLA